jgi:hypothetical protein
MVAFNNAKAAGTFTAAAATSTTVSAPDVRSGDIIILTAKNLLAMQTLGGVGGPLANGIYVSATAIGSFTVTHDAGADGAIFYYGAFRNF